MRISIIHTKGIPFKAFLDNKKAIAEYERLRDLDDYVDYSVIDMPVEDASQPADTVIMPTMVSIFSSHNEAIIWFIVSIILIIAIWLLTGKG